MPIATLPNPKISPVAELSFADAKALVQSSIRKVTTIATLPEVTARIVATVEDPKSTASQLHKIISNDPALVMRILKVVNSAFYGLPGQIGSVERAIVLLGLNAVKNLAVAASLGQLFRGVKLCEGFTAKDLWAHCVAVAVTSRELARQMRVPFVDEAFLAGLIHDVGLLVALHVYPEKLQIACEIVQKDGGDFCTIERQICGVDHQQLGMGLVEQWKLTQACQQVAGYHHRPHAVRDQGRILETLVYVADTICAQHHKGFYLTAAHQTLDMAALEAAGITQPMIEKIQINLDQLIESASTTLG
jgi:HD-like signal output (HDOD) protein